MPRTTELRLIALLAVGDGCFTKSLGNANAGGRNRDARLAKDARLGETLWATLASGRQSPGIRSMVVKA